MSNIEMWMLLIFLFQQISDQCQLCGWCCDRHRKTRSDVATALKDITDL